MKSVRKTIILAKEALRILRRNVFGRNYYKKHTGNSVEICKQIIKDRWNGIYFSGGDSIYNGQFWIRDTSICLDGLISLGYDRQIKDCLKWAVDIYKKNNEIGTTILRKEMVFTFWSFPADSLPLLLRALKVAGLYDVAFKHRAFLNSQIELYFRKIFNPNTKLINSESFSTPKDVITRKQTCVANAFMIYLQKILLTDFPFLKNPFADMDLLTPFLGAFWVEKEGFFRNDIDDDNIFVSSDANLIPYWLEVIDDDKMNKASLDAIKREGLGSPFPLKYHSFLNLNWVHWVSRIIIPNYQGNSIWSFFAPMYIDQLFKFYPNEAQKHLRTYINLIEHYKTYVEVFEPWGKYPLKGRFGHSSETGMLWVAMIPPLIEKIKP